MIRFSTFEGWTYEKIPQLVCDDLFDYARIIWRKTLQTLEKALDANTTQLRVWQPVKSLNLEINKIKFNSLTSC
jgi:hypothetical protein